MKGLGVAVIVVSALAAPALAQSATVKVINQSKWEIHHMFASSSADEDWGPDQLGDEILATGDSLTLTRLPCDTYDVMVVDEDGDECIIDEVDLCRDNSLWRINNRDLLQCEGFE
jgi:hypothetical protein